MDRKDKALINRLRDALSGSSGLGRLGEWAQRHTFLRGKPYSFKAHEYAQAIMDDDAPDLVGLKCRQVGYTELITRLTLSLLATTPNVNALLLLPHVQKALKLVKSRYDPVIQSSPAIRTLLVPGADSSSFKQIGTSQLFAGGTWSGDVISDPVDLRIVDEYDYCNYENLVTSESSMDHSIFYDPQTQIRGIRRNFSTPITTGIGVSRLYEQSDQRQRLVRHSLKGCNRWFHPSYLDHLVIPGYDNAIKDLTPTLIADLDQRGLLQKATLLCPHCHSPLSQENLLPEHREWVPLLPSKSHERHGYHVTPFDQPYDEYNRPARTPEWLLRQRLKYSHSYGKFLNHVLGLPYSDETNSINVNNLLISPTTDIATYGLVAGIDVGKTSYLMIGKPQGEAIALVHMEQITLQNAEEELPDQLQVILNKFRPSHVVIDAYPYTPSVLKLQSLLPYSVFAADYFLKDTNIRSYVVHTSPTLRVTTNRTRTLSAMASKVNKQLISFPPNHPELPTVIKHLDAIKKVSSDEDNDAPDTASEVWQSNGADHYAHALNYLTIAAAIQADSLLTGYACLPQIRSIDLPIPPDARLEASFSRKGTHLSWQNP